MIPQYIHIYELADLLCVSCRTVKRRTREMRKSLGTERWGRIETEQAISYFNIPRYKIEKLFESHKRVIEDD